jgi:halocyanin-like protein
MASTVQPTTAREGGFGFDAASMPPVHWAVGVLSAVTGAIHLYLYATEQFLPFLVAGVVFFAAAGLFALAGCLGSRLTPPALVDVLPPDLEPDYGTWFDTVSTFDGTHDRRGRSTVVVEVGTPGDAGFYTFAAAAIAVSPGTTVRWEWTGKGGPHDVVASDGLFKSGPLTATKGHVLEHTFETPGVYRSVCVPHAALGTTGVVVVLPD